METLLATTLVRSNGICAKGMRTAFVFVWGAFIQILTVFHWAMITRFAFTSETSGNVSTYGIAVFFTISLKRLKSNNVTWDYFYNLDTMHWGKFKSRVVLMTYKVKWQISLLKRLNTEEPRIPCPLSSSPILFSEMLRPARFRLHSFTASHQVSKV